MSKFEQRTRIIVDFWRDIFGMNPTGQCCISLSVLLLSFIYFIALIYLVPKSVFLSFKNAEP